MNFTTPTQPVQELKDLLKDSKHIKPLNEVEQQCTKGGGCNCNEKRIRRTTIKRY